MIRFLAISILLVLLSTSCALRTTQGLRQIPLVKNEVSIPYFANPELDYVYKAKIEVYKRNFGGIVIIKKTSPQSHRIVMTTEFGSKLLDFEYNGDTFTQNFIIEDLDRRFILNVLKEDFKLLLIKNAPVLANYESPTNQVYKTQNGKRFDFYFFGKSSEKLERIVNTTNSKEKVEVDFRSSDGQIAEKIVIKHNNIKLRIDLEKFKEEHYVD